MATATRQTKRPFQASITSYFGRTDHDSPGTSHLIPSSSPLSPPLPAKIQSSLLNVGMRVRKSVPEGYKTASCTASGQSNQKRRPNASHAGGFSSNKSGGFAELTPYCGILKIGGHTAQPLPSPEEDIPPLQFEADDYGFPSSQESATSSLSTNTIPAASVQSASLGKKRPFADEDIFADVSSWQDDVILPVSARFIAVPRTRRRWHVEMPRKGVAGEGQENIIDDFEEADFLRACVWNEREVVMGGV
ncbi:MAG: hypothetical protein M1830_001494 [Pleopsidium flavum]|nr:MAG: hypothetical protein M1830_001494 [Pleopsidium flavum]